MKTSLKAMIEKTSKDVSQFYVQMAEERIAQVLQEKMDGVQVEIQGMFEEIREKFKFAYEQDSL